MARAEVCIIILVFVLGKVASSGTCAEQPDFLGFEMDEFCGSLKHRNGTKLGSVCVNSIERGTGEDTFLPSKCFRIVFAVIEPMRILRLRAGMFVKGDSIPDDNTRYNKKKHLNGVSNTAKIDICPSRIKSVKDSLCCDSDFEFLANALLEGEGTRTRAW
eukprot:CAMPEP_0184751876 /NCGR_PEP_ID=MMETSP0315-20130426/43278_1 /TAXON_ID=101924 /ORGANISM="Rhodosorus marinus, Strain UTEX LB 2760" /LENGTH=159 /DNA_ID=CAMNT_0027231175 /DNA_START=134 /DNA_END=610 /DNA_ORIENTATION=+